MSKAESFANQLREGLEYTVDQPLDKFHYNIQQMYFEFFIGMGWDNTYLIEKIAPCVEKVEKIFGGKNNMTYTFIVAQQAELLVEASLGETG